MVPLVRPYIPSPEEWLPFYEKSRKAGQYSNFGPCEQAATQRLNDITGKNCLLTSSGTAALQSIVGASFFDVVAVPDFTFRATLSAVIGCSVANSTTPCGEDGLPQENWLLKHANSFSGFVVTAPFGSDPKFELYDEISDEIGRPVVYDCAGGWGLNFSRTKNPVAVSFHATKNLAIGEGGAILLDKAVSVGPYMDCINFKGMVGFNGKMSEIHAAILQAQLQPHNLRAAEQRLSHRRLITAFYIEKCPKIEASFSDGAPSLCAVIYAGDPEKLINHLARHCVTAKRGYWPMLVGWDTTDESLSRVVCLPSDVTFAEAEDIAKLINEAPE